MSEFYDNEELLEGTFTISFKLIVHYQREDPILTEKLKSENILRVIFAEAGIP